MPRSTSLLMAGFAAISLLAACSSSTSPMSSETMVIDPPTSERSNNAGTSSIPPYVVGETTDGPTAVKPKAKVDNETRALVLADRLNVNRLAVAVLGDGFEQLEVILVNNGSTTTLEPGEAWVWADGEFVYGSIYNSAGPVSSTVMDFDGNAVCEVFGDINKATRMPDGSVAVLVDATEPSDPSEPNTPQLAVNHDCTTGGEQLADPWILESDEGSTVFVESVGEQTFTFHGDEEGNADVVNEQGLAINGDDYAGSHTFSGDGSVVVYGDYSQSIHVSSSLRARSTTIGELLWSAELDRPFISLTIAGPRLFVGMPAERDDGYYLESSAPESILVLNLITGDQLDDIPTDFHVLSAS